MKPFHEYCNWLVDLFIRLKSGYFSYAVPLKNNENYQPFFIVGSGRSGNTLLRRVLNQHSELFIPPETYVVGQVIRCFRQNSHIQWSDLCEMIYSYFENCPEFETFKLRSLDNLVSSVSSAGKEQRSLAFILNGFYQFYRDEHSISSLRWGDKTPLNTFSVFSIFSVFPDAKFIHMMRDPYDVCASYLSAGLYGDVSEAAWRWRNSEVILERFTKAFPESTMTIQYENLVQNPEKTTQYVCDFLDVEFEPLMLSTFPEKQDLGDVGEMKHHGNVMHPINTESIGKGMLELSQADKKKIDEIVGRNFCR